MAGHPCAPSLRSSQPIRRRNSSEVLTQRSRRLSISILTKLLRINNLMLRLSSLRNLKSCRVGLKSQGPQLIKLSRCSRWLDSSKTFLRVNKAIQIIQTVIPYPQSKANRSRMKSSLKSSNKRLLQTTLESPGLHQTVTIPQRIR